jgi:hypothetical protein
MSIELDVIVIGSLALQDNFLKVKNGPLALNLMFASKC